MNMRLNVLGIYQEKLLCERKYCGSQAGLDDCHGHASEKREIWCVWTLDGSILECRTAEGISEGVKVSWRQSLP